MAGYYTHLNGDVSKSVSYYKKAAAMSSDYCFPSRIEEQRMLEDAIKMNPSDYKAHYYLGNLLYFYEQKDAAIEQWKESVALYPKFGIALRNLGFATDKHIGDKAMAAEWYRKAIAADPAEPKYFQELDIIEEAMKLPSSQRLARMDKNKKTIFKSDDATTRRRLTSSTRVTSGYGKEDGRFTTSLSTPISSTDWIFSARSRPPKHWKTSSLQALSQRI